MCYYVSVIFFFSRKIREIYMDSLIDIQLEAQRINVQLVHDATSEEVNVEEEDVESCEVVTTGWSPCYLTPYSGWGLSDLLKGWGKRQQN